MAPPEPETSAVIGGGAAGADVGLVGAEPRGVTGAGAGLNPGPGAAEEVAPPPSALPAAAISAALAADDGGGAKLSLEIAPRLTPGVALEAPPLLPPPRTTSCPCARGAGFQFAPKLDDEAPVLSCGVSVSQSPEFDAADGLTVDGVTAALEDPALPPGGTIRSGSRA